MMTTNLLPVWVAISIGLVAICSCAEEPGPVEANGLSFDNYTTSEDEIGNYAAFLSYRESANAAVHMHLCIDRSNIEKATAEKLRNARSLSITNIEQDEASRILASAHNVQFLDIRGVDVSETGPIGVAVSNNSLLELSIDVQLALKGLLLYVSNISTLRSLRVYGDNSSCKLCRHLSLLPMAGVEIWELHLVNVMGVGHATFAELSTNTHLKRLRIVGGCASKIDIADLFRVWPNVIALELEVWQGYPLGGLKRSEIQSISSHLSTLSLQRSRIGPAEATAIGSAVSVMTLDLAHSQVDSGLEVDFSGIRSVRNLYLAGWTLQSGQLKTVFRHRELEVVDLRDTNLPMELNVSSSLFQGPELEALSRKGRGDCE